MVCLLQLHTISCLVLCPGLSLLQLLSGCLRKQLFKELWFLFQSSKRVLLGLTTWEAQPFSLQPKCWACLQDVILIITSSRRMFLQACHWIKLELKCTCKAFNTVQVWFFSSLVVRSVIHPALQAYETRYLSLLSSQQVARSSKSDKLDLSTHKQTLK